MTTLKLKVLPRFPASVTASSPILLSKTGGNYAFSLDVTAIRVTFDPLYAQTANNLSDLANPYTAKDNISKHGADIASAATVNLETATGDLVDVTGTVTITAITLSEGHERTVRFTGALILTNGASLVLPGGANITTAAGDFARFRGYAAGVVRCVGYTPLSVIILSKGQYPGETTTGSATAGNIGEYVESVIASASKVALVTATPKTITSISLTAGDWDVDLMGYILPAATTATTLATASIATTTNILDTTPGKFQSFQLTSGTFIAGNEIGLAIPPYRLSLSGTTTVFFVARSDFTTSTSAAYGIIRARRLR